MPVGFGFPFPGVSVAYMWLFDKTDHWGLKYVNELLEMQVIFYRRLYSISCSCPNYFIRMEFSLENISAFINKPAISYLIKLLTIDNNRYARFSYRLDYFT